MKNSSVHVFDYNQLYQRRRKSSHSMSMIKYATKPFWFKTLWGILIVSCLAVGLLISVEQAKADQVASPTLPGVYATVIYTEPINVRSGPSTVHYPIVGR